MSRLNKLGDSSPNGLVGSPCLSTAHAFVLGTLLLETKTDRYVLLPAGKQASLGLSVS